MTRYWVLFAAALLILAAPCSAQQDPGTKVLELEARIDRLTRRVEALEAQVAGDSGPGVRTAKDLIWRFDSYVAEAPFRVTQQELDRKTGQVELLLNLVSEPVDVARWRQARIGGAVPIEVESTLAGDETLEPVHFTLYRRTDFAVGSYVHVVAQLPAGDPQAVRRLAIRHDGLH